MCIGMRQLVLLITAVMERDEDAMIEVAGHDTNRCACELCTKLVEAPGRNPPSWALDVVSRDRWVVRGLFCQEGDSDGFCSAALGI